MPYSNVLPSYESLLEFQEVYVRAIALSWKDETFKQAFLENPGKALEKYFLYRYPWTINLSVILPSTEYGWDKDQRKWNLPTNMMSVGVPVKPVNEEWIALAAYSDAGVTNLFTCC
jgi:ribosomally synthesized peptide (two-chain TOMM family)